MSNIKLFESNQIRSVWDAKAQKWFFAIVDVIAVLTESLDPGAYWRKLKERLKKEGNETVTNCHGLKMTAADGKKRVTDVADAEQPLPRFADQKTFGSRPCPIGCFRSRGC
ncbi:MAG: hypothetical protein WC156_16795 [Pedobacter sp.]